MLREDRLTRVLAVVLLLSLLGVGYLAATPNQSGASFAEFYLLDERGTAADYPTTLAVGETGVVRVGVTNNRRATATYTVVVTFDGRPVATRQLTLAAGETVERPVSFTPRAPGDAHLRARLYRGAEPSGDPALTLRLGVTVTESPETAGERAHRVQFESRPLFQEREEPVVGRFQRPERDQ